jgi:hypothetical protein
MALLLNPPTYLSLADLKAFPNDLPELMKFTDDQLTRMLNAASAKADAIMHQSFLPNERIKRCHGNGTGVLNLHEAPLLYVRQMRFAIPGTVGFTIPANQILVDYDNGVVTEFAPFAFSGLGYISTFPENIPIDVTLASGYGYAVPAPTPITITDAPQSGLTAGAYDIQVTSITNNGESLPSTLATATTVSGAFKLTFPAVLGAFGYRVYMAATGLTPKFVGEISGAQYESSFGGYAPISITISSLAVPVGTYPRVLPIVDTTAQPFPGPIVEATRLMVLEMQYEQNSLANRGVSSDRKADQSGIQYRNTMGTESKGMSWMSAQARDLLLPYKFSAIY